MPGAAVVALQADDLARRGSRGRSAGCCRPRRRASRRSTGRRRRRSRCFWAWMRRFGPCAAAAPPPLRERVGGCRNSSSEGRSGAVGAHPCSPRPEDIRVALRLGERGHRRLAAPPASAPATAATDTARRSCPDTHPPGCTGTGADTAPARPGARGTAGSSPAAGRRSPPRSATFSRSWNA